MLRLLTVLAWLLTVLPRGVSLALGSGLGAMLEFLGWKRDLIFSNLKLAFPGADVEREGYRAQVANDFYRHFGRLVIEILMMFSPRWKNWVRENVVLHGLTHFESAHARGYGVIFACSHLGNWEAMAAVFGTTVSDSVSEICIVTKQLKPNWIHRAMERNRSRARVRGTYEPKTLKDVLAQLKRGGAVGFVLDQYAGPPIGIRVPFFGVPVGTLSAPAVIARRTGAVVLPAHSIRHQDGRIHVFIGEAFSGFSEDAGPRELASHLALWVSSVEQAIKKCPAQWLWSHRRFKGDLSPLGSDEWDSPRERR